MQPPQEREIAQDITTLADYIYQLFGATEPVEVQNILDREYTFKYCTDEEVQQIDQLTKKVVNRTFEELTLSPGQTHILLGGAAYIFLHGVATAYTQQSLGDDATGNLSYLADAVDKALIGRVNYKDKHADLPVSSDRTTHNPNVVSDNDGQRQTNDYQKPAEPSTPEQGDEEQPFAHVNNENDESQNIDDEAVTEFDHHGAHYKAQNTKNGQTQFRKNGGLISAAEFADAHATMQYEAKRNGQPAAA